jgi:bifunctional non-homologous end joining protein LigD
MEESLKQGMLEVFLRGKKVKGGFAFVRTDPKTVEKSRWLLIKMRDDYADARRNPVSSQPESVKTGKDDKRLEEKNERDGAEGKEKVKIKIGREVIDVSNPDKLLFPKAKITKEEFVAYYQKIADVMLPYMKNRPIAMHRFPDGITGELFYQKDAPDYFPEYVHLQPVKKSGGGIVQYAMVNSKAALVYLANYVCVFHLWLSHEPKLNYPDRMIFDLDPSPGATFSLIKWTAQEIKKVLDKIGLPAFVMTTGSRGLHVVVPLKQQDLFDDVRAFAKEIAQYLISKHPQKLTLEMSKNERGKKIFLDILRNAWSATSVAPYGIRAKEGAPVATPLEWDELARVDSAQKYTIKNIFQRLSRKKDPWKDMDTHATSIKEAQKKFKKLIENG